MSDKGTTPVWVARAGKHGADETIALEEGLAIIGFQRLPDLSEAKTADDIVELVRRVNPGDAGPRIRNHASQVGAFALSMQEGHIVALPLKTTSGTIALGRVSGPYAYREIAGAMRHTRPVKWVRPDVPRSEFGQDLLYSLGAFMTVCRVRRNDAEERIAAILAGKSDPGFEEGTKPVDPTGEATGEGAPIDVAEFAHDQVVAHLRSRFQGHELARLVEAVLRAEGYQTELSPPGPDGGVDILAGQGSLGLEEGSLCVQVKATGSAADVNVFRALQGTMQTFKADRGLLVSWSGFTKPLRQEARQSFFQVRLWDASDLVQAIYRVYDKLPEEIQAELPLKRIWALVLEDGQG
jgi:restriction system protein